MTFDPRDLVDKVFAEKLPLANVCRMLDLTNAQMQRAQKRERDDADYDTMYGSVMKTTTVDYNGHPIEVDHLDIKAFFAIGNVKRVW